MDLLNNRIAKNLSVIRKKRNLSLDDIAQLTGVTKATLGQIERGIANPTVNTIWKIANGLKISFSSLTEENANEISLIVIKNHQPVIEEPGYKVFPVFSFDPQKRFELFLVELDAHSRHLSEGHQAGTEEYLVVLEGNLFLEVGEEIYHLGQDCALRFNSNISHTYRNDQEITVRYFVAIFYSN